MEQAPIADAPQRHGYPAGVPCWIDLVSPDPQGALAFYGGLFGWAFEDGTPPGSPDRYAVARLRDADVAGISLTPIAAESATAWTTYVCSDDVDATLERIRTAGGTVIRGPDDLAGAAGVAVCADTTGARFGIWQPTGHRGVQRANEDGTWNIQELATPDLDGAKAFYGAAFGWVVDEVDFGGTTGHMVRMPGYGDFIEQHVPGNRQRQAEAGVPPGYEDAVAWMSQLAPGAGEPAWSLTFAVDDVDGAAERASDLGGTLVVEPFDAGPGVRLAVVADPAGAAFTILTYAPPA
jgi:predicted enzyme related to lactoylglutathione lyase